MNTAKEVHPCFRGLLTGFTKLERQQEDISWVDSHSPVNIMEIDSEGFVRIYASTYRSPSVNHYNPCYVNMEFNKYDVPVNGEFKIKATYHFPPYQELDGSELSRTHIWSFHIDQFTGDTEVEIARKITEEIEWSYFDWVFNIRKNKQYYYTYLPEYDESKDIRTLLNRDIMGDDNQISILKLEGCDIGERQVPLTLNEILFGKETGSLPNWLHERDTMPNILSMNPNKGKGEVEYLLYRPNKAPVRCPSAAIHHQGQMLNKMVYYLVKDEIKTPTPWMEKLGITNPEDVFDLDKVVKVIASNQDNKNHQKESNPSVSTKNKSKESTMSEQPCPNQPYISFITARLNGSDLLDLKTHPAYSNTCIHLKEDTPPELLYETLVEYVNRVFKMNVEREDPLYFYLVNTRLELQDEENETVLESKLYRFLVVSETALSIGTDFIQYNCAGFHQEEFTVKSEIISNMINLTTVDVHAVSFDDVYPVELVHEYLTNQVHYFIKQVEGEKDIPHIDDTTQCQDVGDNPNLEQDLWLKPGIIYRFDKSDIHAISVVEASLRRERKYFLLLTGANGNRYIYIDNSGIIDDNIPPFIPSEENYFDAVLEKNIYLHPQSDKQKVVKIAKTFINSMDGAIVCQGKTVAYPYADMSVEEAKLLVNAFYRTLRLAQQDKLMK